MPIPTGPAPADTVKGDAWPHVKAVMDTLASLAVGAAYLSKVPANTTTPYLVLHPDGGQVEQTSLVLDEGWVGYFWLHAVSDNPEQALWVLDEARQILVGAIPAVSNRTCWRIWQESTAPMIRDDAIRPPLFVAAAEFGIRSESN